MRIVVLVAAMLATQILSAQSTDSVRQGPSLSLQLGFRVHDNRQEYASAAGERKILSSPMIGLMLQMPKMPLRVGAQVDFDVLLETPIIDRQLVNYAAGSVAETWIEYQLQAYYDFSKWTLTVGRSKGEASRPTNTVQVAATSPTLAALPAPQPYGTQSGFHLANWLKSSSHVRHLAN